MVVYRLALGLNQAAGLVAFFRNPQLTTTKTPGARAWFRQHRPAPALAIAEGFCEAVGPGGCSASAG